MLRQLRGNGREPLFQTENAWGGEQMPRREFKEGELALTKPLPVLVIESLEPDDCHQCGEGIEAGDLCGYHEERSLKFCLNCLEAVR
jgi:hypothetical protein